MKKMASARERGARIPVWGAWGATKFSQSNHCRGMMIDAVTAEAISFGVLCGAMSHDSLMPIDD